MDFVSESDVSGDSSVQSWYGEPQHETRAGGDWACEYYGKPTGSEPSRPVEFVPEVEHRDEAAGAVESSESEGRTRAQPLAASD